MLKNIDINTKNRIINLQNAILNSPKDSNSKLIHNSQVGFKKGKSTIDSPLFVDHLIARTLSKENHCSIISLDFVKAFDRIGLHTLLDQLTAWKLGKNIYNYIKNFMSNRKITAIIGHVYSTIRPSKMEFHKDLPYPSSFLSSPSTNLLPPYPSKKISKSAPTRMTSTCSLNYPTQKT